MHTEEIFVCTYEKKYGIPDKVGNFSKKKIYKKHLLYSNFNKKKK